MKAKLLTQQKGLSLDASIPISTAGDPGGQFLLAQLLNYGGFVLRLIMSPTSSVLKFIDPLPVPRFDARPVKLLFMLNTRIEISSMCEFGLPFSEIRPLHPRKEGLNIRAKGFSDVKFWDVVQSLCDVHWPVFPFLLPSDAAQKTEQNQGFLGTLVSRQPEQSSSTMKSYPNSS